MKVKNCLLDYRFKLKIKTQKQFAEYLGVNQQTYNKWENNIVQPPLDILFDIADILGVSITDIVYPSDSSINIPDIKKREIPKEKIKKDVPKRITTFSFWVTKIYKIAYNINIIKMKEFFKNV